MFFDVVRQSTVVVRSSSSSSSCFSPLQQWKIFINSNHRHNQQHYFSSLGRIMMLPALSSSLSSLSSSMNRTATSTTTMTTRMTRMTRMKQSWIKNNSSIIIKENYYNYDGITGTGSDNITLRTFFASSTDHTNLLKEAEVHCITTAPDDEDDKENKRKRKEQGAEEEGIVILSRKQFVLVASGMDIDMVQKVPQLHLARIFLDEILITNDNDNDNTTDASTTIIKKVHGTKVINRTLGNCQDVCSDKLLTQVLMEAKTSNTDNSNNSTTIRIEAYATLHGLSDWILKQIENNNNNKKNNNNATIQKLIQDSDETTIQIVKDIAMNKHRQDNNDNNNNNHGIGLWKELAIEYVKEGHSDESNLYMMMGGSSSSSAGGTLSHIDTTADTSEYATTCGNSMAVITFS